jgi:hypothetical protein
VLKIPRLLKTWKHNDYVWLMSEHEHSFFVDYQKNNTQYRREISNFVPLSFWTKTNTIVKIITVKTLNTCKKCTWFGTKMICLYCWDHNDMRPKWYVAKKKALILECECGWTLVEFNFDNHFSTFHGNYGEVNTVFRMKIMMKIALVSKLSHGDKNNYVEISFYFHCGE